MSDSSPRIVRSPAATHSRPRAVRVTSFAVILDNEERSKAIEADANEIDEGGGIDPGDESLGNSLELLQIVSSSIDAIERLLVWPAANCKPPYRAVFEEDLANLNAPL